MTGRENVIITAIAPEHEDLTRIARSLDERGLDVEREELVRHHYVRPFNHVGTGDVTEETDGTHEVRVLPGLLYRTPLSSRMR